MSLFLQKTVKTAWYKNYKTLSSQLGFKYTGCFGRDNLQQSFLYYFAQKNVDHPTAALRLKFENLILYFFGFCFSK